MSRMPLNNSFILLPCAVGMLDLEHYAMRHFVLLNTVADNPNIHMRCTYLFCRQLIKSISSKRWK